MEILKRFFVIVLLSLFFNSCGLYLENLFNNTDSVESRASSIADFAEDFGSEYDILLVSDVHFDASYAKNERLFEYLSLLSQKPAACFVLGDLTRNCSEAEFESYKSFCSDLKSEGINKIYAIPGNHDCDDGGRLFLANVFPHKTFYRILTKNLSYYFCDSSEGSYGDAQIANLREVLRADPKKKIVFSHYPLYVPESFNDKMNKASERAVLISIFASNAVDYYFCGHTHEYYESDFGKVKEVVLPDLRWSNEWIILHIKDEELSVFYDLCR